MVWCTRMFCSHVWQGRRRKRLEHCFHFDMESPHVDGAINVLLAFLHAHSCGGFVPDVEHSPGVPANNSWWIDFPQCRRLCCVRFLFPVSTSILRTKVQITGTLDYRHGHFRVGWALVNAWKKKKIYATRLQIASRWPSARDQFFSSQ